MNRSTQPTPTEPCAPRKLHDEQIQRFRQFLSREEKSRATVDAYACDVKHLQTFLGENPLDKERLIAFKKDLCDRYAPASANRIINAVNCFLRFLGATDCCVKPVRVQRQMFCREETELTLPEYRALLRAAEGRRIWYLMQTICGTGIRVSELQYITAEAVHAGKATVRCKGKTRIIFITPPVQRLLREYMETRGIRSGCVFRSENETVLSRTLVWRDMKALCEQTGIPREKVFPHNLRHLFARLYYAEDKDIVRLADLLGHSSIDTTRIYTIESGEQHLLGLERVQKALCIP